MPGVSVSFNTPPDFFALFSDLRSHGIGGMKRQAMEIYQRVFLSRSE